MTLYENFNTSLQTSPHFERHEHLTLGLTQQLCSELITLPMDKRCAFIESSDSCNTNVFLINYFYIIFCKLEVSTTRTTWGAVFSSIGLLIIVGIFFIILGVTADLFFCPALAVLARMLGMSENVAGVTLVAFGNGASDIFSSLAYLNSYSRRLYADIFASSLFVVLIVSGIIFCTVPFAAQPYLLLRDALFLLLDICVVDYMIKEDNAVSAIESAITICIYFSYLFVVIFDQYLIKRAHKNLIRLNDLSAQGALKRRAKLTLINRQSSYNIRINFRRPTLMRQFISSLNPYNQSEWESADWPMKIFYVLRMPILSVLLLLMPIIDIDESSHGWSRLLNCLQFIILPTIITYATFSKYYLFGLPICIWTAILTLPIAILIFKASSTNRLPHYHQYFSILTVAGSIFVVRVCCAEVLNIITILSFFTGLSSSFFGATLLAWINSIGDLISNQYLARQGFQNMALAACFGGPLFNSLLAVGSTLLYTSLTTDNFLIEGFGEGIIGENCTIFLIISLVGILLGALSTDFYLRPSYGIFIILMYVLFFLYNILGEFEVIHFYGTDHRMDVRITPDL
ncbi:mitochondrial sodium/calcium exchanger protein-like [Eurosta solidaginis]|uniref:mitochondrial sodium/calcium exchanger protein-like n=1 Tax=Eurosta solidaginis TaxID=178769 RepID=UPI00353125D1